MRNKVLLIIQLFAFSLLIGSFTMGYWLDEPWYLVGCLGGIFIGNVTFEKDEKIRKSPGYKREQKLKQILNN